MGGAEARNEQVSNPAPKSAQPTHFVSIDLGTSRIKAAVFDDKGRRVAQSSYVCTLQRPHPGWCEQDLEDALRGALQVLRDCVAAADLPAHAYAALALTGQGDGTRLVDVEGAPLRPAILWQDARASAVVRRWESEGRADAVKRYTGTMLSGSQQSVQLAWLLEHEPEVVRRARHIFFAKDWLFFHLTGAAATDQSDSSHTYFDIRARRAEPRILDALNLTWAVEKLPPELPPGQSAAALLGRIAEQIGLPAGLPVVLAPFDVVSEMIAVGGFEPGVACSVIGTAGIHQVSVQPDSFDPTTVAAGCTTYAPGEAALIRFVPNMLAVPNIEFWAALLFGDYHSLQFGFAAYASIEEALARIAPGADGVLYIPFLSPAGERAPYLLPEAHASFTGLSLHHSREHLLRAVYEGVALAAAESYAHLPLTSAPVQMTGGGARSPLLAQILADVLGRAVQVSNGASGAVHGAMLFARTTLGYTPDLSAAYAQVERSTQVYLPNEEAHKTYRALHETYRALVARLHLNSLNPTHLA
ncbi:MAG: carbohydrate kinase [Anaerolineae bacterium]|nr:carbohydrate kinase [Anaerolineae bacterium]